LPYLKFNIKENYKGYLWAFTSVLAVSNVYIFSKIALNQINIIQFGFYWFGLGLLWFILFANFRGIISKIRKIPKKTYSVYLLVGLLETISTTCIFYAIDLIENPSVTSFLTNLTPVLVTIMSFFILKETFSKIEIAGVFMAITGAFIISYIGNTSIDSFLLSGSEYVYISSFTGAILMIIVKKNIKTLEPQLLTLNRTVFLFFFSVLFMILTSQDFRLSTKSFYALTAGSFLGPFLNTIAAYHALKYLEAYKQSIINTSKNLFVLLGSFLFFGKFPLKFQIIGGIFTIAGVLLVSFGKSKKT
jgi:drug/metabolite transporter (DMT)-like permease